MIFLNNYLNRNSLTQTTASASTKRSNLFIQMQPEFKALGTSLMAKLQIQRFIKPFLNSFSDGFNFNQKYKFWFFGLNFQ